MVDYDELMYTTGESEDGYNSYDGYDGYDYGYDFFRRRYYDSNENEEDEEEEEKEDTHAKTLLEQFNSDSEDSYTEEELLVYAKKSNKFKSAPNLIEKAAQGDANAYFLLGKKYSNGLGAHKAKLWYLKAANNSHPRAQVAIGDLYNSHTFHCSKRDIQKALDWYLKAHENGNKEAAYIIAKLYKTATSIENRKQICLDWYKTAYEGGDAEAAYDAGVICYNEGDFKGAMEWFVKAEQLGHSNAAVIIGEQYNNGSGVEKDPEEAVKWYKKAYLLGTCGASHRIAEYYDTIDKAEAFKWWYRSSTAHDSAIAKRRVMELKEEGYELNRRNKVVKMIEQDLDIIRMEHQDKIKSLMEQLYAKDDIIKSLQEQKST